MNDELSIRQMAIRLRLAGKSVESICRTLKRSKSWFHKWWQRYLTMSRLWIGGRECRKHLQHLKTFQGLVPQMVATLSDDIAAMDWRVANPPY